MSACGQMGPPVWVALIPALLTGENASGIRPLCAESQAIFVNLQLRQGSSSLQTLSSTRMLYSRCPLPYTWTTMIKWVAALAGLVCCAARRAHLATGHGLIHALVAQLRNFR